MQNKPNFPDALMNVTSFYTADYENIANCKLRKNKPNSKPNKPNFQKAQMNATFCVTKAYENESAFGVQENKPNQTQSRDGEICNYYDAGPGNLFDRRPKP